MEALNSLAGPAILILIVVIIGSAVLSAGIKWGELFGAVLGYLFGIFLIFALAAWAFANNYFPLGFAIIVFGFVGWAFLSKN